MFDDYDHKVEKKKRKKSRRIEDVPQEEKIPLNKSMSDTNGSDSWTSIEQQQDERDGATGSNRDELDDIFTLVVGSEDILKEDKKKKKKEKDSRTIELNNSNNATKKAPDVQVDLATSLEEKEKLRQERKRFMASKADVLLKKNEIRPQNGRKRQEAEYDMEEFLKIRREIQSFGTTHSYKQVNMYLRGVPLGRGMFPFLLEETVYFFASTGEFFSSHPAALHSQHKHQTAHSTACAHLFDTLKILSACCLRCL
jgi:hypothetical protein